jgi:hypothetical protein
VCPPIVPPPAGRNGPSLLAVRKYESVWRWTIVRHPDSEAVGLTHADNVIAELRFNDGAPSTRSKLLPLKLSALP